MSINGWTGALLMQGGAFLNVPLHPLPVHAPWKHTAPRSVPAVHSRHSGTQIAVRDLCVGSQFM
ncbi:unnamed protein product [Staurois parvus]|uniref:Uncharacterized protein n=1 Tax=Staurois parvus TaxID=386267 RepID=A0ABN9EZC1_9NEOB|nr:unnamed protein product [Staurois parvus]